MQIPNIDTSKVFGKPAISFLGLQIYYDCYKHGEDSIFLKDRKWFRSNPRQQRVIRPALGVEFNHADAHIDHLGKRIAPSKLWVSVEQRMGGQQHVVQPVYRGPCFWKVDKAGYLLSDAGDDDNGNTTADVLLYRMHLSEGMYLPEMMMLAEKVAEGLLASTKQTGPVH